jgi:hypothetical protein
MKSAYIERRYKMNALTTVIVKSKKEKDADIYKNSITIVTESTSIEPLRIGTKAEIEEAVKQIDLEDNQINFFPENKEKE